MYRQMTSFILLLSMVSLCFYTSTFAENDKDKARNDSVFTVKKFYATPILLPIATILGLYYGDKLGDKAREKVKEACRMRGEPPLECDEEGDAAHDGTQRLVTIGSMFLGLWVGVTLDASFFGPKRNIRLGVGHKFSKVTKGPNILFTANLLAIDLNYGFPRDDCGSDLIYSIKRTFQVDCEFHIYGELAQTSFQKHFKPFFGVGYIYMDENDKVKSYTGDGYIMGLHPFIGCRVISPYWNRLGLSAKFGYSFWDYNNSVLKQNNAVIWYNLPRFYFDLSATFFIK